MNPRIRALGETVLRVKDLERVKRFYAEVIGLDVLREFDGIAFLKVSDGYGGHTQIIGLFHESLPALFPKDAREPIHLAPRSITSRSKSTRTTLTPSWLACSAWEWRSPRSNTGGAGGGPCTSATRRAISSSWSAMTLRSITRPAATRLHRRTTTWRSFVRYRPWTRRGRYARCTKRPT